MPNVVCLKCDHHWWSDAVPQRCPNRECNSRRLQVSELPGEPPLSPTPEKPSESTPSAKRQHPLEAKCREMREVDGAVLCEHNRLMYPPGHPDFVYGCPACIRMATREIFSSDAQLTAAIAAAQKPEKRDRDKK